MELTREAILIIPTLAMSGCGLFDAPKETKEQYDPPVQARIIEVVYPGSQRDDDAIPYTTVELIQTGDRLVVWFVAGNPGDVFMVHPCQCSLFDPENSFKIGGQWPEPIKMHLEASSHSPPSSP